MSPGPRKGCRDIGKKKNLEQVFRIMKSKRLSPLSQNSSAINYPSTGNPLDVSQTLCVGYTHNIHIYI
jgi:hypothetical protein